MIAQRILLVDDDTELGNFVSMALTSLGYQVHFQNSLLGVESIIRDFSPSIILFDVEIGADNGIEKAETILKHFKNIPILFISSHTDAQIVAKGITTGGVGYIRKPFKITELAAYIKRFALDPNIFNLSQYKLNAKDSTLFYNDSLIKKLSTLEFKLLHLLILKKNTIVSKEQIATTLWGGELDEGYEASINNLNSKLRELLNKDSKITIETIRGKGFRLIFE
ncbi:DNA-binding response OmpR family regulator [Balneicella halophila]|uniref:DNA-binding response OmpR family regulator n=1 Tax=Balneicella halophila TaxID=1537566 RepID=A0A7L4UQB0_BALHA|nr:response regulator transcription factor [Balneicella halophila]PVX51933.1 DNA-binding response OmpR family regulator [Balneicella halophila]